MRRDMENNQFSCSAADHLPEFAPRWLACFTSVVTRLAKSPTNNTSAAHSAERLTAKFRIEGRQSAVQRFRTDKSGAENYLPRPESTGFSTF